MNAFLHIGVEIIVVTLIIFGGYFMGFDECVRLVEHSDVGQFVGTFGILWGFGSFFRISKSLASWGLSFFCAVGLFLFGHALSSYGAGYALITGGVYAIIMAAIIGESCKEASMALILVAATFICIGFPIRKHCEPTARPAPTEDEIGTHPESVWRVAYVPYKDTTDNARKVEANTPLGQVNQLKFVGTTEQVKVIADQYRRMLGAREGAVKYTLLEVPPDHAREVGAYDWLFWQEQTAGLF